MLNIPGQINDTCIIQFRANSWLLNWNSFTWYRVGIWGTIFMAFRENYAL